MLTPGGLIVRGLHEPPRPPVEIADEVEAYARQSGRHATLRFNPTLLKHGRVVAGTWVVRMTLKADDEVLSLYQEGKVAEPPTEDVWLHVPDPTYSTGYRPLDLVQLGAGGVRTFLEKGNLWSGRGEFTSLDEQVRKVREQNERQRTKNREQHKEANRFEQLEKRRWRLKIPFLLVEIDLGSKKAANGSATSGTPVPALDTET